MAVLIFQCSHSLPYAQVSNADVLGGHQAILVKQGNLNAASSHIHNGCSFLDDSVKLIFPGKQWIYNRGNAARSCLTLRFSGLCVLQRNPKESAGSWLPGWHWVA